MRFYWGALAVVNFVTIVTAQDPGTTTAATTATTATPMTTLGPCYSRDQDSCGHASLYWQCVWNGWSCDDFQTTTAAALGSCDTRYTQATCENRYPYTFICTWNGWSCYEGTTGTPSPTPRPTTATVLSGSGVDIFGNDQYLRSIIIQRILSGQRVRLEGDISTHFVFSQDAACNTCQENGHGPHHPTATLPTTTPPMATTIGPCYTRNEYTCQLPWGYTCYWNGWSCSEGTTTASTTLTTDSIIPCPNRAYDWLCSIGGNCYWDYVSSTCSHWETTTATTATTSTAPTTPAG